MRRSLVAGQLTWPLPGREIAGTPIHANGVAVLRALRLALVDSAVWTALTLAALPVLASHLLAIPLDLRPSALIFASGVFIYNLDHFLDASSEEGSAATWTEGIGRATLGWLVVGSGILVAVLLASAPAAVGRVFVTYGLVGIAYGLPVLPLWRRGALAWLRLKDIPGMKAAIVAGSITVAAVGLPVAWSGAGPGAPLWSTALLIWVLVVSNAIMCDVGDLRADRVSGVQTLPVLIGVEQTRLVVTLLALSVLALFSWGVAGGMVGAHPEAVTGCSLVILYAALVTERTPKAALSLILDGCSFAPLGIAWLMHGTLA